MGRGFILFVGGLIALLAAFAFKQVLIAPPAVPEVAEPGTFDTQRAFARLERILAGEPPHPVDSAGSDIVRDRLLAEMRAVGLRPRVTDEMVCNSFARSRAINCARVRNLAATIGPAEGEHLLIVAHYDSVPVGPGASDAGIGIATMLEIAEQLRGRPLAQPVTFLFNEGEESGLLGARAFLEQDPLAARVTRLVNLEARGVDGPAIMFETSRPNGAAIDLYRAAVNRPVANSLSTDFYRLLPNSTDVTVFEERPWTILNFAIIGNETRYHSAGDDLAALDRRSLLHMGSQALAIARLHAAGDAPGGAGELVYADVLTRFLIALPLIAALVLLGLAILLLLIAVVRRQAYGPPVFAALAAVGGAGLLAWLLTAGVQLLRPGEFWRAYPLATQVAIAAGALLGCVLALGLARGATRDQLRAAFWLVHSLAGAAICAIAPGAAIYFLLPQWLLLAGILVERWRPGAEPVAAWLAALAQLLILLPVLALVDLLLSTSPGWVAAPVLAMAALPVLIELRPETGGARAAPLAAFGLAAAAWTAVLLVPAYSEDRQQIFTVEYALDQRDGTARWGIYSDGAELPGAYQAIGQWVRQPVEYARRDRWLTPAPALRTPTPQLAKVRERLEPAGRVVTLRLAMNGWNAVSLDVPASAELRSLTADGSTRSFGGSQRAGDYAIRCAGRSCDGFTFELLVGSREPVDATLIGTRFGLPEAAAPLVQARPALARPQYVPDATYALVPVRL